MTSDEVERCSCDESLLLREELVAERAKTEAALARAQEFENHWHNACDVGRRLERQLETSQTSVAVLESRVRELLPLRDGLGRLSKEVVTLRKDLRKTQALLRHQEREAG